MKKIKSKTYTYAEVYNNTIPTMRPELPIEWVGPYVMFDLKSGWAIETPMGAVIMERLTVQECYYIAYALNEAYPVKVDKSSKKV